MNTNYVDSMTPEERSEQQKIQDGVVVSTATDYNHKCGDECNVYHIILNENAPTITINAEDPGDPSGGWEEVELIPKKKRICQTKH